MSFNNGCNFLNKCLAHLLVGSFWLLLLLYFLISFYLCTGKLLIFESWSCIQEHYCPLLLIEVYERLLIFFFIQSCCLNTKFLPLLFFFILFFSLSCLIVRTSGTIHIVLDLTVIVLFLLTLIGLLLKFYCLLWSLL